MKKLITATALFLALATASGASPIMRRIKRSLPMR